MVVYKATKKLYKKNRYYCVLYNIINKILFQKRNHFIVAFNTTYAMTKKLSQLHIAMRIRVFS